MTPLKEAQHPKHSKKPSDMFDAGTTQWFNDLSESSPASYWVFGFRIRIVFHRADPPTEIRCFGISVGQHQPANLPTKGLFQDMSSTTFQIAFIQVRPTTWNFPSLPELPVPGHAVTSRRWALGKEPEKKTDPYHRFGIFEINKNMVSGFKIQILMGSFSKSACP